MCQAFEPATSTQDKSLSTVGFPTRRAARSPTTRFSPFFFFFSVLFLSDFFFFSSCYFVITLLLFLCRFRAAFALWYFTWILFFLVWLYSAFFEGRRILGYSGRAFDSVEVSRIPGSSRILESTDQNCGRIPRFWVFESLDSRILGNSEISRDHRVLRS